MLLDEHEKHWTDEENWAWIPIAGLALVAIAVIGAGYAGYVIARWIAGFFH